MRHFLLTLLIAVLTLPGWAAPAPAQPGESAGKGPDVSALGRIPAQESGRLKPLDTVARESVRRITGKAAFRDEEPMWTHLRWMSDPQAATAEANIECRNLDLKKALDLNADQRWFSLDELRANTKLLAMQEAVQQKARGGDELSSLDKEFEQLAGRMELLMVILDGDLWKIVPHPTDMNKEWQSLAGLKNQLQDPKAAETIKALGTLLQAAHEHNYPQIQEASVKLGPALATMGPVPPASLMDMEMHYNSFHPFRWAWILYMVGLLPLLFAPNSKSKLYWVGMAGAMAGFALHSYGFYLRCSIAGRPPVTNMYESVIWVAFGAVLFALVFEMLYRARVYLMAALVFSIVALVLADNLPAVLDPAIKPLMPVLRNNFWLTIHVLTITLSYAAFGLALGLGHMVVWGYAFPADANPRERLQGLNTALYKAIQIGVLLLAAGTILGGVWANYSWGRFWGWDPKEVWALIALLGYLALLHGRYAGWLRQYGLAAWSILAFMGVMMAWYGVNFVLGAGLHSYGFGTGGLQYVAAWVTVEVLYLAFVTIRYRKLEASKPGRGKRAPES